MRALVQRVDQASVDSTVDGVTTRVGEIGPGLLVLVGVTHTDTEQSATKLADKIWNLRIMGDVDGVMNLSVADTTQNVLVVSQFTLAADTSSGTRPSFTSAAPADEGRRLYDWFVAQAKAQHPKVQTGIFGADMKVHLVNDGPVTIPITIIGA